MARFIKRMGRYGWRSTYFKGRLVWIVIEYARMYLVILRDATTNVKCSFSILWFHIYGSSKAFDMKYTEIWLKSDSLIKTTLTASYEIARYRFKVSPRVVTWVLVVCPTLSLMTRTPLRTQVPIQTSPFSSTTYKKATHAGQNLKSIYLKWLTCCSVFGPPFLKSEHSYEPLFCIWRVFFNSPLN